MADKTSIQDGSRGPARKLDLNRVIRDLNEERNRLARIIDRLEQMRADEAAEQKPRSRRGRKSMDAAGREEVSLRMRKYWEGWRAKKNQAGESSPPVDPASSSRFSVSYAYNAESA